MIFNGYFDNSQIGDPHLLPNIMTARERDRIKNLDKTNPVVNSATHLDTPFQAAVQALYNKTRNPYGLDIYDEGGETLTSGSDGDPDAQYLIGLQPEQKLWAIDENNDGFADNFVDDNDDYSDDRLDGKTQQEIDDLLDANNWTLVYTENKAASQNTALVGTPMMLSAGRASGEGYVTLAFNNDASLGLPVSLQVMRVGCSVYQGNVWIVPSDNIFEEALTLRHSADFAGDPDNIDYQ